MTTGQPIIGLWINHIPDLILNDDELLRELSDLILQDYRAKKMVVADSSLMITMQEPLPQSVIQNVAQALKKFLTRQQLRANEIDDITISTYDDPQKWEAIKQKITAAVDSNGGGGGGPKPVDQWSVEDVGNWLKTIGLAAHVATFAENDIDGGAVTTLDSQDIKDLGLSIGHRKKLKRGIDDLLAGGTGSVASPMSGGASPMPRQNMGYSSPGRSAPAPDPARDARMDEQQYRSVWGKLYPSDDTGALDGYISKATMNRVFEMASVSKSDQAAIWRMSTADSGGVCVFKALVNIMKLLSFAQRGVSPDVLNIQKMMTSHPELPKLTGNLEDAVTAEEPAADDGGISEGKMLIITGIPRWLLDDDDYLFDFEKLVFQGYRLQRFEVVNDGLIANFQDNVSADELGPLTEKFRDTMGRLQIEEKNWRDLKIDFFSEGGPAPAAKKPAQAKLAPASAPPEYEEEKKVQSYEQPKPSYPAYNEPEPEPERAPAPVREEPKAPEPQTQNFLPDVEAALDLEDVYDGIEKLNNNAARMFLSQIRQCPPFGIKKDEPGMKLIHGLTRGQLEDKLRNCTPQMISDITGQPIPEPAPAQENLQYVGMSVDGLPRFITDHDEMVGGIESSVFEKVGVSRITVLDTITPPGLRIEFQRPIGSDRIPQLARRLKNFLKAVKVSPENLNDVTIAFLDADSWRETEELIFKDTQIEPVAADNVKQPQTGGGGMDPRHRKRESEPLIPTDAPVELAKSFIIEGLPQQKLDKDDFLEAMEIHVFKNFRIAAMAPTTENLEVMFATPIDITHLPKVAMRLKKFLKRQNIAPSVVNGVTLQIRHEDEQSPNFPNGAPTTGGVGGSGGPQDEGQAVVGLIFKGIPSSILSNDQSLYGMEDDVFTTDHPIKLMEPVDEEQLIRITLEHPIYDQGKLQRLAQRLKKFLARNKVTQQMINDVLVMSFAPDKWQNNNQANPPEQPFSPTDYVGIEIENMPVKIVDSDQQLELIEQRVFQKQRVIHMNVIDTTLRITFGVPADSKAIEKVARELKRFLSQMNIPIKQINDIIIAPHTTETWEMPMPGVPDDDANVDMGPSIGEDRDLKRVTVESWKTFLREFTQNLYSQNVASVLDLDSAKKVLAKLRQVPAASIQGRGDPGLKYLVGKTFAEVDNVFSHTTLLIARALFGYSSRAVSQAGSRRESWQS